MKKILLSLAVVALLGAASCSKEKTCECVTSFEGDFAELAEPVAATTVETEEECADFNTTTGDETLTIKLTCTEK